MARIELWNGDICELEVDAIVNAANTSLWMSTGVGGAIKRAGGDAIEFAAVRQAPVELGSAIVTSAGTLAARYVIHAISLDRDRRTSGGAIEAAMRSTFARARELGVISLAFPALGTGVGILFAWLTTFAVKDLGVGFSIPVGQLVVFLLLAVVVGVLGAVAPARRAARLQILEAVRSE